MDKSNSSQISSAPDSRTHRGSTRVFISYRRVEPDMALAHRFHDALVEAGHRAFIDDRDIRWGSTWTESIEDALKQSDYMLLLLSREAANSEMVKEEIHIARRLVKKNDGVPIILPMRIRFPLSEPLPYGIAGYLREIQQRSWDSEADTEPLIELLLQTLSAHTPWNEAQLSTGAMGALRTSAPQPQFDPRDLLLPGGAVDLDSSYYVEREPDAEVLDAVQRRRALVTVRGPRQAGKTSLIMRVFTRVQQLETPLRAVFVDIQAAPPGTFESIDSVWLHIADQIATRLRLDHWQQEWRDGSGYDRNFSGTLDRLVFKEDDGPLLICLDEVDRLFSREVRSPFFASLRAFFNRGAMDPTWKSVRWLLGTSSEPSFFIDNLSESPFNIGLQVGLDPFDSDQVEDFAARHGIALDEASSKRIIEYLGGRPYLTHLLFYRWAKKPERHQRLFDYRHAEQDLFRDHLHRYLLQFQQEPALSAAMLEVINGNGCPDVRLADRLSAAGLVKYDDRGQLAPLCGLYSHFFSATLDSNRQGSAP